VRSSAELDDDTLVNERALVDAVGHSRPTTSASVHGPPDAAAVDVERCRRDVSADEDDRDVIAACKTERDRREIERTIVVTTRTTR